MACFSQRLLNRSIVAPLLLGMLLVAPYAAMAEEPEPVASISLSVLPDTPDGTSRYDTMLRYVFTVANAGTVLLTDVTLTDTLCGDVGTAASLAPGFAVEFEGWARVESGEGVATVRALAPGSVEVSATATHAIEPYISHEWPDDEAAEPEFVLVAEQSKAPAVPDVAAASAADEPYPPFTGEFPAKHFTLATGFAFLGVTLRRYGRAI